MLSKSGLSFFYLVATFFLLAVHNPSCEGASQSSQCTYAGYKPGGPLPGITRISPVAPVKFEETALDNVFDYFNNYVEFPKAALDVVSAAKGVLKTAPAMSAALGVIAAAMELSSPQPTANEILQRAHQSVDLLAEEVNERVSQMQDYADVRVLDLEKDLMTKRYRSLSNRWVNCGNAAPGRDSDECQSGVEEVITSDRFYFQQLQPLFDAKKNDPFFPYRNAATWQWIKEKEGQYVWPLKHDEVKKLEVGLIPFRDYATLHLIVMETLANTYKDEGAQSCASYKHYLNKLALKADYYVRYVKWAYEWIYIRQYEENMYFGIPGRTGGPSSLFRGGFLGTRVCTSSKCTMECSQMFNDNVCTVQNSRRKKRATLSDRVYNLCDSYMGEVKKQVTEFWTKHLLNVADKWKRYGDDARAKHSATNC